jgi:hypothetical protein
MLIRKAQERFGIADFSGQRRNCFRIVPKRATLKQQRPLTA